VIENVKGLVRPNFARYFSYLILQLTYPEITPDADEDWPNHLSRLERYHTAGRPSGLHYQVVYRVLNAADYGVPQTRDRVVIVGFRSDLGVEWSFPAPTHSREELLFDQWITGDYWDRHQVAKWRRPTAPASIVEKIVQLSDIAHFSKPWRTVRDVIGDLPEPKRDDFDIPNHRFQPGVAS
jgi:DNA (cytosine-5)-methyltransferase 1